jgi:4'-phosphopantetheinyl transferase
VDGADAGAGGAVDGDGCAEGVGCAGGAAGAGWNGADCNGLAAAGTAIATSDSARRARRRVIRSMLHPNATPTRNWMPARPIGPLHDDEVQVWRLRVDLEGATPAAALAIDEAVTAEDRDRAGRFRQEADRQRFLHGRLLLRTFLGHHLGITPRDVRFVKGEHGKPEVDRAAAAAADDAPSNILRFNLAHSGEWLLFALARDREVGVDVEQHRTMSDAIEIARRFFAPPEVAELDALDPALHHDTFFRVWTRKEAIVKATGQGISAGLDRFAVTSDASDHVTLRGLDGDPVWNRWTIRGLDMPTNYTAAVAFDNRRVPTVTRFEWTPW